MLPDGPTWDSCNAPCVGGLGLSSSLDFDAGWGLSSGIHRHFLAAANVLFQTCTLTSRRAFLYTDNLHVQYRFLTPGDAAAEPYRMPHYDLKT